MLQVYSSSVRYLFINIYLHVEQTESQHDKTQQENRGKRHYHIFKKHATHSIVEYQ